MIWLGLKQSRSDKKKIPTLKKKKKKEQQRQILHVLDQNTYITNRSRYEEINWCQSSTSFNFHLNLKEKHDLLRNLNAIRELVEE